ncbi:hypothetical protein HDE_13997 [Halotydeus destructor]|nr:hypothetical protein HDE_13997 [Halotydeus destructor]
MSSKADYIPVMAQIRDKIRETIEEDRTLYDEKDIERTGQDDGFIRRIISFHEGTKSLVDKASSTTVNCLKWRKENQINGIGCEAVASEIINSGRFEIGRDSQGRLYFLERIGLHKTLSAECFQLHVNVITYLFEVLYKADCSVFYFDVRGASLSSMDMVMIRKYIDLFTKCFPGICSKAFIFGVPALLSGCVSGIMRLLPEKHSRKAVFISKKEAETLIDNATEIIRLDHCPSLVEVCSQYQLSGEKVDSLTEYWSWVKNKCSKESEETE